MRVSSKLNDLIYNEDLANDKSFNKAINIQFYASNQDQPTLPHKKHNHLTATMSTRQSFRSAFRVNLLVPSTRVKFHNRAFAVEGQETCQSTSGCLKLSLYSRVAWRHICLNSHTERSDDSSDIVRRPCSDSRHFMAPYKLMYVGFTALCAREPLAGQLDITPWMTWSPVVLHLLVFQSPKNPRVCSGQTGRDLTA